METISILLCVFCISVYIFETKNDIYIFVFLFLQYYFEGRYDLVRFIKLVKQAGLYVNLRIGPYVCAEWNFG